MVRDGDGVLVREGRRVLMLVRVFEWTSCHVLLVTLGQAAIVLHDIGVTTRPITKVIRVFRVLGTHQLCFKR